MGAVRASMLCADLDPTRPTWIFGAGKFGRDLAQALRAAAFPVAGFIDRARAGQVLDGWDVHSWESLADRLPLQQLALGIFNRATPFDELVQIASRFGTERLVMPWDLYARFGSALGWRFWLSAPASLRAAQPLIDDTLARLADDTSRDCLRRIVRFRSGEDLGYASFAHGEPQYFNALTLPTTDRATAGQKPSFIYVDGGAYDGDTFLNLQDQHAVSEAWLFEPDPANFARLLDRIAHVEGCATHCLPLGLAASYQTVSFVSDGGEGGAITANLAGHAPTTLSQISVVALDAVIGEQHVDFLKLDVEGAEEMALQGAASVIRRCAPILAISLYHKPDDLWVLPGLVHALRSDYRLYIRQHFWNSFESVLYALPGDV